MLGSLMELHGDDSEAQDEAVRDHVAATVDVGTVGALVRCLRYWNRKHGTGFLPSPLMLCQIIIALDKMFPGNGTQKLQALRVCVLEQVMQAAAQPRPRAHPASN